MVQKSLCARAQEKSRPKRFAEQLIAFGGLRIAAFINCAALVTACVFLLINGAGALNWEFVFDAPRKMMTEGGVWPCLVGTFLLAAGAIAIALPFGVACAVWLNEYSKDGALKASCVCRSQILRAFRRLSSGFSGSRFSSQPWALT